AGTRVQGQIGQVEPSHSVGAEFVAERPRACREFFGGKEGTSLVGIPGKLRKFGKESIKESLVALLIGGAKEELHVALDILDRPGMALGGIEAVALILGKFRGNGF